MKIAIVGSGISGQVAAYKLHSKHDVTIFEANDYIGGHTNTVDVQIDGRNISVDTGFIVFNDRTYPNFWQLLEELGVSFTPTSMSFSVRAEAADLEYNGGGKFAGLFAQKRNLLRPSFYRMLRDILRFNRQSPGILAEEESSLTVGEYLHREGYSTEFAKHYLLPMGASIWSCPTSTFAAFPIHFIVEFYINHGLLSLRNRPTWQVVDGGSKEYVRKLSAGFKDRIHLNTPVRKVIRHDESVDVLTDNGTASFDEVIFACHSDQALQILSDDATIAEREILGSIPYEPNTAVLHTDESLLPKRRKAWACWNYHIADDSTDENPKATLTYNMNMLQHLKCSKTLNVTLNADDLIDPATILGRYRYSHPIFTVDRKAAQSRHAEVIRARRTSFCGAYWGNGFHEDGVVSGLKVAQAFSDSATQQDLPEAVHA